MKQFTQAFWIARKNNLTLHYNAYNNKWLVLSRDSLFGFLDLYSDTDDVLFIDFHNDKAKYLNPKLCY